MSFPGTSSAPSGAAAALTDTVTTGSVIGATSGKVPTPSQPSAPKNPSGFVFGQLNVAASQTNVALTVGSTTGASSTVCMPWGGSIVGIGVAFSGAVTAGTITVIPAINGTNTQVSRAITSGQADSGAYPYGTMPFAAGDRIGCKITTDGSFAPTTTDVAVTLFVDFAR